MNPSVEDRGVDRGRRVPSRDWKLPSVRNMLVAHYKDLSLTPQHPHQ